MTAGTSTSIAANVAAVRARIAAACERAGRDPASVRLVAVTKTVPAAAVAEALAAGVTDVGENYVREGAAKRAELGGRGVWHLIGHLQTNKVRAALQAFDTLQAVDSLRLAEAVSRHASRTVPVLLEVNAAGEATKFGFAPADVGAAAAAVRRLPDLELRGLMTVAPATSDPEALRPLFRSLRRLAEANRLQELSMGMSGDFEVAVEEGATMVRIGRAIFGERAR
ncbi:MAG TPA: YggS family pyridoxal phosphate-dependent enzyme [Dehalococcoidia bacterium]|nr:YggS family pyridoxal phosphate-dependent enzyme [Dehalococcoidia bacterium]